MHLKQELERRGLLKQHTHDELFDLYETWGNTFYVGMDPTADSLHLGNFVWFMHALQYMKRGNKLIFIIWGATGMIGDPWGKNSERSFLDETTLQHNVASITTQVTTILDNITQLSGNTFEFEVINNLDFYTDMNYITFLRDVGKHITVNQMIKKETVKRRIEEADQSISYTEFSYMLMQGYDFFHLFSHHDCKLQIAWSDQRGNIVTGIELIRKVADQESYGATTPLVVDSTWRKFGKSEWNALRLDPQKNSPYVVYQYFMNTADEDIEKYLKLLTILEIQTIQDIISQHENDQSLRYGQSQLAFHVLQTIFGTQAAEHAVITTDILFGEGDKIEKIQQLDSSARDAFHHALGGATTSWPIRIGQACITSGLVTSGREAKDMIKNAALYLNETKITDPWHELTEQHSINGIFLLRKWKKTYKTLTLTSS